MAGNRTRDNSTLVAVSFAGWIELCEALSASLDVDVRDLALKARRLTESRSKYARRIVALEGQLLKKCPELDQ